VNVSDLRHETQAALSAIQQAWPLVTSRTGGDDVRFKSPNDPVTATDELVQDSIEASLKAFDPSIVFVGEESSGVASVGPRFWLVDPICGTKNYAARMPLFCCNVALVEHGRITLSAIGDGSNGSFLVAERGVGSFLVRGEELVPLVPSARSNLLSLDPFETNLSSPMRGFNPEFAMRVIELNRWETRVFGSSVTLPMVADGRLAGTIYGVSGTQPGLHLGAGLLIAQEAGAFVTNELGVPWEITDRVHIVAADPGDHRELLRIAIASLRAMSA
jgi:myo-inositol-1(or 4)-monophosphatase